MKSGGDNPFCLPVRLEACVYSCPLTIQDAPRPALISEPSHSERGDVGGGRRQPRDASCTSRWGTKGNRKLSLFICKTGVTWAKKRFLSGVCSVICCHSHFAYVGERSTGGHCSPPPASPGNVESSISIVLSTSRTSLPLLHLLARVHDMFYQFNPRY